MPKARRASIAPRLEALEARTMLSASGRGDLPAAGPDPAPSVLIRFTDATLSTRDQAALAAVHARAVQSFPDGPTLAALPAGSDLGGALRLLGRYQFVRYVEPDATIHVADVIPNDPSSPMQWGLNSPNNVDIDAPAAWQVTTGSPATVVAVIDSGIDTTHPDLAGQLWNNPTANADGLIGDVHGWNFIDNNADISDQNGHGTHVAGILAAAGNNGYGVAGVDWGARLMVLKFIDANGNGSIDAAVQAIYFAVQHGARVINASWGGEDYSQALVDAIGYANAHNVVFVTAAGNESVNNDVVQSYPAAVRLPNTISVAAVDQAGNLADFSNYGSTVDIAAPGVNILSTLPHGFGVLSGTSMSAPFVSGVVALVAGQHPEYTAAQLVQRVLATAKPLPTLAGLVATGGIVDAANAVGATAPPAPPNTTISSSPPGALSDDAAQALLLSSDGYYALQGGTTVGFLSGLFRDVLGRPATLGDLVFWSVQMAALGLSRLDVAQAFLASPEGRQTEVARWLIDDLGGTAPLDALKANPGVVFLANLLAQGARADDLQALLLSAGGGLSLQGGTPVGFLSGLFQNALGRPATAGELIFWSEQMAVQGLSRLDVARAFLASPEGRQTKVARWLADELGSTAPLADLKASPAAVFLSQQLAN
jgi:thermitase